MPTVYNPHTGKLDITAVAGGGGGTGDMLKATYDPANGSRQVAFSDELVQDGISPGELMYWTGLAWEPASGAKWNNTDGAFVISGELQVNNLTVLYMSQVVADDAFADFPPDIWGEGSVRIRTVSDQYEWADFFFEADSVFLKSNSTNVTNTNTDGNLCVFYTGTNLRISNRLGESGTMQYRVEHS